VTNRGCSLLLTFYTEKRLDIRGVIRGFILNKNILPGFMIEAL
jgi:hypothetical protein